MASERTELLARCNPRLFTPKYVPEQPPPHPEIIRPVLPILNERLEMLAKNVPYKVTPKYEPCKEPTSYIDKAVLEATLTPRLDHLSRPFVTKLKATKAAYGFLGKQFQQTMVEKIAMSLDTIYYHNMKSKMAIEAEKKSGKKPKKKKLWDEKSNRLAILAVPKAIHKPPPLRKRARKSLKQLKPRILVLSKVPNRMIYRRPSQDSFCKEQRRRLKYAGKHKATKREKELSTLPAHMLRKEPKPFFGVKKAALKAEMTERLMELAAPRPRANAPEMDLKENPYDINRNALKYKATPRIIKLAKPIDR